jgi:uncharacterized protein (DUF2342 family)
MVGIFILLKSYLTNRHFTVKVDNAFSDLPIHAGVPQGSVLGHLLYISDLPSSPDTTTATFADDAAVLAIDPNAVATFQKLQTSLNAIHHWLSLQQPKANSTFGNLWLHLTWTKYIEISGKRINKMELNLLGIGKVTWYICGTKPAGIMRFTMELGMLISLKNRILHI